MVLAKDSDTKTQFHLEINNSRRKIQLPIKIYIPEIPGKYPLIIFSPGLSFSRDHYQYLGRSFAAKGYLTICISHPGSDSAAFLGLSGQSLNDKILDCLEDESIWESRVQDIRSIIDVIKNTPDQVLPKNYSMQKHSIGLIGHSYGAHTAMLLAGATLMKKDGQSMSVDPIEDIKAYICISPQGSGVMGLTEKSWNQCNQPILSVTATNDTGIYWPSYEKRLEPFYFMPKKDKYAVVLKDLNHLSFLGNSTNHQNGFIPIMQKICLKFWDAYLKKNLAAKIYLAKKENIKKLSWINSFYN